MSVETEFIWENLALVVRRVGGGVHFTAGIYRQVVAGHCAKFTNSLFFRYVPWARGNMHTDNILKAPFGPLEVSKINFP